MTGPSRGSTEVTLIGSSGSVLLEVKLTGPCVSEASTATVAQQAGQQYLGRKARGPLTKAEIVRPKRKTWPTWRLPAQTGPSSSI